MRTADFDKIVKERNDEIAGLKELVSITLPNKIKKLEVDLKQAREDLARETASKAKADRETFAYDEPQGKVLKRRPDGTIEINLGSAVGVRPGLTFSVFPPDYPQKGPKSRMFTHFKSNGRGGFVEETDMEPQPKAKIEVFKVETENLSLARIIDEPNPIRDGATVGDLLYNTAWRKGVGDHVALVGIFDINGDGIDDIETVVKDLTKMGITVDAYYDLRTRAWVGQVTERTRYIVEGRRLLIPEGDTKRPQKEKLNVAIANASGIASQKGSTQITYRDFFARMGYRYRDGNEDSNNKASAPYLDVEDKP